MIAISKREREKIADGELGIVSPDGEFHRSDFGGHSFTAAKILNTEPIEDARLMLEQKGWLFICKNLVTCEISYEIYSTPTQRQLDTCSEHAINFGHINEFRKFMQKYSEILNG